MRQELRKELRVMKQERSGLLVLLGRGSCMLLLSFVQVCKGFNDINGVVGNGSLGIKCSGGSVGVDLGKCGRSTFTSRAAGWMERGVREETTKVPTDWDWDWEAARHDSLLRINLRRSDYREGDKAGHGSKKRSGEGGQGSDG
jgi:hypothetical protein